MKFFLALRFSDISDTYRQEVCHSWDESILSLSCDTAHTKSIWPYAYIAECDDDKQIVKWAVSGPDQVLGMSPRFASDYFQTFQFTNSDNLEL